MAGVIKATGEHLLSKMVKVQGFAGNPPEEATGNKTFSVFEVVVPPVNGKKVIPFVLPTWPINPLDPWKGTNTESDDFVQIYVEIDGKEVECVAQVIDNGEGQIPEVEIGDCWTLKGESVDLSLEERDAALEDWMKDMGSRAKREES